MTNWSKLKEMYRAGRGFRPNDVLEPIEPIKGTGQKVRYCGPSGQCLVLEQHADRPWYYDVIATPNDGETFEKFEINGYEWRKVGHA